MPQKTSKRRLPQRSRSSVPRLPVGPSHRLAKTDQAKAEAALEKYNLSLDKGVGARVLFDYQRNLTGIKHEPDFEKARDRMKEAQECILETNRLCSASLLTPAEARQGLKNLIRAHRALFQVIPSDTTPAPVADLLADPKHARKLRDAQTALTEARFQLCRVATLKPELAKMLDGHRKGDPLSAETRKLFPRRTLLEKEDIIDERHARELFDVMMAVQMELWPGIDSKQKMLPDGRYEYRKPGQGARLALADRRALLILKYGDIECPHIPLAALLFLSGLKPGRYGEILRNCHRTWDRLRAEREAAALPPPQ